MTDTLIIQGGGSEILEDLTDDKICEEYGIINWDLSDNDVFIIIKFIDNNYRIMFIGDYNLEEVPCEDKDDYNPFRSFYQFS